MQWLQKFFRKKPSASIVGMVLPHGISIAVVKYTENNRLKLIHLVNETEKTDDYATILKRWFIDAS